MSFLVREARVSDVDKLYALASQFSLLSLPYDKKKIAHIIETSCKSFRGELNRSESLYLFVAEDLDGGEIAGCSQIKAQKGSESNPAYAFTVKKRERFSKDLGIGFIHQILRLKITTDGPSEIAGLIVNRSYRKRPEKIGKLIGYARFLYIAMYLERFSNHLLSEMAPPLTDEGRSEFWEALGRRFTGMPYQEADALSHKNKEFIKSLFPEEDIYLCLLDAQARLVLSEVNEQTRPAVAMLKKIGFAYKNEVDPFDGGPHMGATTKEVSLIKNNENLKVQTGNGNFLGLGLVSSRSSESFQAIQTPFFKNKSDLFLPQKAMDILSLQNGDDVSISEINI